MFFDCRLFEVELEMLGELNPSLKPAVSVSLKSAFVWKPCLRTNLHQVSSLSSFELQKLLRRKQCIDWCEPGAGGRGPTMW